jgi:2'-hydroxyisoflavone reductase
VADWIVHCLEKKILGVYNVTGPAKTLSMKGMVENVRTGTASQVEFAWIKSEFLETRGIDGSRFPLYASPKGDSAGLHRCNCARALARGLVFRPLSETANASLDWYRSLPAATQAAVAPQFAARPNQQPWLEIEKHALQSWNQRANR